MPKCKFCKDGRDYEWDTNHHDGTGKWRLWDTERELPHKCGGKKKKWDKQTSGLLGGGDYSKGSDLWKKDWKPIMDVKSRSVCGICKTVCITKSDCKWCAQFKLNPCNNWCPKCEEHPRIINVEKDPQALEEFYEKYPEEKPNK